MASYQTRQRDPLLDQGMQAMLERRGKELMGLALIALGVAAVLMLWTYAADDPGWMVATDGEARNAMGRIGAAAASTLVIICGLGAWAIPVILFAWGVRFLTHRGEDRAIGRMIFAVIGVAVASVFAATHVPGADWTHSFGLGGLFGDTIVGALLGILPFGAGTGLRLLSVLSGVAVIAMGLYVTGFDRREIRVLGRFLLVGLVMSYNWIATMLGRGAAGAAQAAQAARARHAELRDARLAQPPVESGVGAGRSPAQALGAMAGSQGLVPPPLQAAGRVLRADMRYAAEPPRAAPAGVPQEPALLAATSRLAIPALRPRGGLLARVPGLMKRSLSPELVEPALAPQASLADAPPEDRIRARISDAIRSRAGADPAPLRRAEPPVIARQPVSPPAWGATDAGAPDLAETAAFASDDDDDLVELSVAEDIEAPRAGLSQLSAEQRRVVQHLPKKPALPSRQAVQEAQPRLRFDEPVPAYEVPPLSLLSPPPAVRTQHLSDEALEENARMLESVLDDYGVKGEITSVRPGPVVTMYELEPAPGLKASRVIGLADDIARSMSALSARVSTVPGRTVIGIELPNAHREKVVLREILSSRDFGDGNQRLPLALGKDIGGDPVVANLAKMPHLLIAGTTGSGKSVAINTMILSLLYKLTPEECRLIMIDPKMLELSVYDGIPHLLSPVVTDPKKAVVALKWVVGEMEERYRKMSRMGVRNIEGYNGRVREALARNELFKRTIQTGFDDETGDPVFETEEFAPVALPYIVVIVDEMADLMMVAGKEIEACIQRLAQMARASGIHLIMATQRPSVDVITGTIKANFPTRISFQVTSKIDSRTILGEQGAEQLLGMGDMLYMAGGARITRIHGPFVSDEEVEEIVNHLKSFGPPVYMSGVVEGVEDDKADDIDLVLGLGSGEASDDALYDQAVAIVAKDRKCSTSYIQRKLGIGYNKAARLVEQMEDQGVVTPANHVGKREILLPEH